MKSHSVQEMKNYLEQSGAIEYSEGQFAGSINTLLRNKTIIKIDRDQSLNFYKLNLLNKIYLHDYEEN